MKIKLKDKIFTYRFATEKDIDTINRFDINIYRKVNPDFYFRHTKTRLRNMMSYGRKIWMVFCKDKLVAWTGIALNLEVTNAKDYNLTEKQIEKAGDLVATAVSPKFRGYGIQQFLLKERIKYLRKIKKKYALTDVNPKNIYSLRNIEATGFKFTKKSRSKKRTSKVMLNHYILKL